MPAVIELHLKAARPLTPDTRKLHGVACALFEGDHTTADHLGQDKPFAIWPLQAVGETGQDWLLRVAWLPGIPPPEQSMGLDQLRVGHTICAVTETTCRTVTHARLAAGPTASHARISFRSPVYFSQNGTDSILPDPRLIIGSWRRNWNNSLPDAHELRISDEAGREIHRATRLADFQLTTTTMDSGRGYGRTGFTGDITLCLHRGSPADLASRLATLTRFAEYCGTGAQTTHGFGATVLDDHAVAGIR